MVPSPLLVGRLRHEESLEVRASHELVVPGGRMMTEGGKGGERGRGGGVGRGKCMYVCVCVCVIVLLVICSIEVTHVNI
jgi:hypothetical protein